MIKENNLAIQGGNCSKCSDNGYRTYCFKDDGAKKVRIVSLSCQNCSISSAMLKPKAGKNEVEIDFEEALELTSTEGWVSDIDE